MGKQILKFSYVSIDKYDKQKMLYLIKIFKCHGMEISIQIVTEKEYIFQLLRKNWFGLLEKCLGYYHF